MTENSKKPRIRFKGFTDTWEQRKVSEIFKITRGYVLATPLTSERQSDEMPYPVYSSQTKDNGLMGYFKDYLYEDAITWTTDGANAGTVNYRTGKFYCTNVCGVLLADKAAPNKMIAEALNNVAKGHVSYVGNPKLMNNVMAEIEITLPATEKERQTISFFFDRLDNLITLHQCKWKTALSLIDFEIEKRKSQKTSITWEQRKLESIAENYYGGGTPDTGNAEYWDGTIAWIQSSDLIEHDVLNVSARKFISEYAIKQSATQKIPANSIAVVTRVGVGKVAFLPFSYATSQDFVSLSGLKVNGILATYLLYMRLQKDMNMVQGTSIKGITKEELLSKGIIVPITRKEQENVGELFQRLDNLITLHQRKELGKEEVKNAKIVSLQKPDNCNSWEQRKFSETVLIERGGSPRPIDDYITDEPDGLNWVKIGDAPEQGNYITKTAEKIKPSGLSKTREVHPNDLILSNSMSFGKPYIMAINGCIHDGWLLIRDQGLFELKFLCHLLGTAQMLSQYKQMAAGSTVNNLNKELVGNTVVRFPEKREQEIIGDYFEKLDDLITLHQRGGYYYKRSLLWLKQQKKQNYFVIILNAGSKCIRTVQYVRLL